MLPEHVQHLSFPQQPWHDVVDGAADQERDALGVDDLHGKLLADGQGDGQGACLLRGGLLGIGEQAAVDRPETPLAEELVDDEAEAAVAEGDGRLLGDASDLQVVTPRRLGPAGGARAGSACASANGEGLSRRGLGARLRRRREERTMLHDIRCGDGARSGSLISYQCALWRQRQVPIRIVQIDGHAPRIKRARPSNMIPRLRLVISVHLGLAIRRKGRRGCQRSS
mmetsp:Transcript_52498/g.148766  ORF Transcript_52498/g.148766 Transcript_52498/m.148766 type:complete len:226 (+) Transcript_52498:2102-2779(+)